MSLKNKIDYLDRNRVLQSGQCKSNVGIEKVFIC